MTSVFSHDRIIIAPSILSADFANLARDTAAVLEAGADIVHVDIMDNHFVPNLTIGPCVAGGLRKSLPKAFLDCHLMVTDPASLVPALEKAGADLVCFHIEATGAEAALALAADIRARNMRVGVAIKPKTPASALGDDLLAAIDMVLVMTVEPGFGGQSYMPDCAAKCKEIRARAPQLAVQVDGGISPATIAAAAAAGANVFVAGSAVFGAPDWKIRISELRENATKAF